jgi:hypothetical protein
VLYIDNGALAAKSVDADASNQNENFIFQRAKAPQIRDGFGQPTLPSENMLNVINHQY